MIEMRPDARIFVAGHRGLVGSAVVRRLAAEGFEPVLTVTRDQLDLRDQTAVNCWFRANRPEYVFLVAGTVGGIMANSTRPAEFIYDNMMIHATVVHAAHSFGVKKLLYLGSSCIYPRECAQPMAEEALLAGPLEPTNEPYAIAKIAGIKLCQAYGRQYGCRLHLGDAHEPLRSPRQLRSQRLPRPPRPHPEVPRRQGGGRRRGGGVGDGRPRRELLHVDDLADACVFLMRRYDEAEHVNVGTGEDLTIRELAEMVRDIVYPEAALVVRHRQARRHPPQAPRRAPPDRARLAVPDPPPRRDLIFLSMVPGEPGTTCAGAEKGAAA